MKKLICFIFILTIVLSIAAAEEDTFDVVYILCQPDSYVNIRARPSSRSEETGYFQCGDSVKTDGKKKNGFLHVFPSNETGEGWVSLGYVICEEPEMVWRKMEIVAKGRVNARKTVNGKRRTWVKPGTIVMVYWIGDWAVTNKGFIKSEFLEDIK